MKNSTHYDAGDGFIIEKNDVKEIVDFANGNFIEVIPEIPSLTHAYSLLARHPELAEYPGDKWPEPGDKPVHKLCARSISVMKWKSFRTVGGAT